MFKYNRMLFQFSTLLVLIISAQITKCTNLDAVELQCLKDFGYDKNIISYDNNRLSEDNSKMNAFFSCVWKKKGLQRPDGSLEFEKIFDMLLPEAKLILNDFGAAYVVIQSINVCEDTEGDDHGGTVVKAYNCLFDNVSKFVTEFRDKFEAPRV